jgi:Uma2 family endonuclease
VSEPAHRRMTSDEFIAWAMEQPETGHYELVAGEVVAMAPERSAHALTKAQIWRRMAEAVEADRLPCQVFPDGMAVEVDEHTVYEPDAPVRCGAPLPADAIKLNDPVIIVEVLSPSMRARDSGAKLEDYFRLPSLRHYLIVKRPRTARSFTTPVARRASSSPVSCAKVLSCSNHPASP